MVLGRCQRGLPLADAVSGRHGLIPLHAMKNGQQQGKKCWQKWKYVAGLLHFGVQSYNLLRKNQNPKIKNVRPKRANVRKKL